MMKYLSVFWAIALFITCTTVPQQQSQPAISTDPIVDAANHLTRQFKSTLQPDKEFKIAALEFTDYDNRVTDLGVALANQLIDVLFKSGYTVVERIDMLKVLSEPKLALTGLIDEKSAALIGNFYGASAIAFGSIERGQGRYRISSRIVHTTTGQVLASATSYVDMSSEVLSLNNRVRLTISPQKAMPMVRSKDNLLANGDFSQPLDVGWERQIGKLDAGATKVQRRYISELQTDGLYIHHVGDNRLSYSQEIDVAGTDLIFECTFQMKSWEGMFIGFSGTGTAFISIYYLNAKGQAIGATHLFNSVRNLFADTPLVGVPRGPEDSNRIHNISIPSEKLYQNYRLDIDEEISNNLLAVQKKDIGKIRVSFGVMANDRRAGCEMILARMSLKYR
ncbi:MAG TPA: FlgO family outer membrane protein [bacterium]|nr:FlgO family outer membrane protein [bacterium]HOX84358.1 FlgO family outer membrane protein [bacterium]HPG46045.1 FlgO family outer membrane protein [bacterium]HPM97867.1 FlgO family outer membrane protein [bacterium]